MAYVNPEYVTKLMQEKDLKFFVVLDSDGKSILADQQNSDITLDKAVSMLKEVFDEITGPYVIVKLRDKSRKQTSAGGDIKTGNYDFKVKLGEAAISGPNAPNATITGLLNRINALETALVRQEKDFQLKELQRQFDEFKENQKSPYLEQLMPLLASCLTGSKPAPIASPGIAGVEDDPKEKIKEAIKRLAKVDKNIADTLTALADFAERKPEMYMQYIPLLKTM